LQRLRQEVIEGPKPPLPSIAVKVRAVEFQQVRETTGQRRRLHLAVVGALGDKGKAHPNAGICRLETAQLHLEGDALRLATSVRPHGKLTFRGDLAPFRTPADRKHRDHRRRQYKPPARGPSHFGTLWVILSAGCLFTL
jgi:hypothetical protein